MHIFTCTYMTYIYTYIYIYTRTRTQVRTQRAALLALGATSTPACPLACAVGERCLASPEQVSFAQKIKIIIAEAGGRQPVR